MSDTSKEKLEEIKDILNDTKASDVIVGMEQIEAATAAAYSYFDEHCGIDERREFGLNVLSLLNVIEDLVKAVKNKEIDLQEEIYKITMKE
ncbi:MAG: hypothetical protein ACI4SF_00615 [Oscillospiraceae bacterium]